MNNFVKKWTESSLILKIIIGLVIGIVLGLTVPQYDMIGLPGELFVDALKAIAPILVFLLVGSALSKTDGGIANKFKKIICLFFFSTFIASLVAVIGSFLFPVGMTLTEASSLSPPED